MAVPSKSANDYENSETLEVAWAVKAYHHAETFFNLISSVDSRQLKLTKHDDELYRHFRQDFPDMKIDVVTEKELKSDSAKRKWRPFCNHFDGTIKDFNYGTLLRLDCSQDYSEKNTVFVTRVQFCAIEVARNRECYNLAVWKTLKKKPQSEETKPATEVGSKPADLETKPSEVAATL